MPALIQYKICQVKNKLRAIQESLAGRHEIATQGHLFCNQLQADKG